MKKKRGHQLRIILTAFLIILYLGYVGFVIHIDRGPIDYETFMQIGGRLISGQEVYGENSYYPMPYVYVFGLFAALPRPVSMGLWLLLPPLVGLIITGWNPWVLLFGPMFGHFLGGQSTLFGMLGYWGYRRNRQPDQWQGGLWLALTALKPQLGIFPIGYAFFEWVKYWRTERKIPRQAWVCLAAVGVVYLPSFLFSPGWIGRWLAAPRPLALRAMAGLIPRSLAYLVGRGWLFWGIWLIISVALFIWILRRGMTLERGMLWYFIASPLIHDYDLIQLIPQIEDPATRRMALFLSIPTWIVILFFYSFDPAWFAVTVIAPGLLLQDFFRKPGVEMKSGL